MECQLFCKCSNCDSDSLLSAKVPIWTVNEYRACYQCGSACISSQCSDAEFLCNNCFVVLQEDDIDCDDGEDFGQIFEDGVAAASNSSVSKFTEAVTSIEASSVQEEVHSKIVADLQQCIGPVSKKLKADTRVNLARGFSATKKNSKKIPKVSQRKQRRILLRSLLLLFNRTPILSSKFGLLGLLMFQMIFIVKICKTPFLQ